MSGGAEYTFVPWVRDGYQPADGEDASVRVELSVKGTGGDEPEERAVGVDLSLYGPGEVTGLDRRQVVRTEPTPGTSDFPPNQFPIVEFDRPELPWLFSPQAADDGGRLQPWLCLLAVERTEGVELTTGTDGAGAVLDIRDPASVADHLPDPAETWAWAHAQVVGHDTTDDALGAIDRALETDRSEKTLSRLLSPRALDPESDYYACVVPTYEAGRLAGLGHAPIEYDDEGEPERVAGYGWDADESGPIRLPVYYHWEFSTGKAGDFEALVRRLEPAVLDDVGVRQVDAGDPGPGVLENAGDVVSVEGALRSFDISPDTYDRTEKLVAILNQASALAPETAVPFEEDPDDGADGDRVLGPPIYGQWPPATPEIPGEDDDHPWLRELNEDPRFRVPAAFGTDVVQDQQEQLMAEAWRQVGAIREANKLLRRARLARGASQQIYDALDELAPAALLSLTEPAHRRIVAEDTGRTIAMDVEASALPTGLLSPAFRRITRPNGPLARRLGGLRRERIVEDVNDGTIDLGDDGDAPAGANVLDETLAEELCTSARERAGDVDDWAFLGTASEGDLADVVERLRERCQNVREAAETAMQMLDNVDPDAARRVSQLLEHVELICGEHDEVLLSELAAAVEDENWSVVVGLIMQIHRRLSVAEEHHDALSDMAEQDADLAYLLDEDPGLSPAFDALMDGFFHLRLRLIIEAQFPLACRNAKSALESMDDEDPEREQIVAALGNLCMALCSTDAEAGGLLGRLREAIARSDVRGIRDVLDAMSQVVALARPQLAEMDDEGADAFALRSTCEEIGKYVGLLRRRLAEAPFDPVADAIGPGVCPRPPPEVDPPLDLPATAAAVLDGTDPAETIRDRIAGRLNGLDIDERDDPLAQILAHPEFDQPMYAALRDRSQENLVPGVGEIPLDSVGALETNPRFVESYLLGLSHEMARELRWREYPTDLRGTYFRQFWDPEGRDPPLSAEEKKDIDYVHTWDRDLGLGGNYLAKMDEKAGGGEASDGDGDGERGRVVLVIRGALFDRYPNTHVYAAKGVAADDGPLERRPNLPDPVADVDGEVEHPIFRGELDPDVCFFGFDLDQEDVLADPDEEDDHGWFFVIEEPPSEPSFGLDVPEARDEADEWTWEDLTWDDVTADGYVSVVGEEPDGDEVPAELPEDHDWGKNGAHMGAITWIRPFRAAIHADDVIPMDEGNP